MITSLVTELNLQFLLSQVGVKLKVPSLYLMVGSIGNQPPSFGGAHSHFINTSKDTFIAFITRNVKDFSSSVPKIGTKTKHVFLIMNHNIT